jgi:DNA-binding transcriptional ArsR family regulator
MRNQTVTDAADRAFQALADPTRRALLDMLRDGTRPAGTIAEPFDMSRPAISKHLRLLLRANLVRRQKQGRHRIYRLNPEPLQAVDRWLERYRAFWQGRLANLKAFVEAESGPVRPNARRRKSTKHRRT